MTADEFYPWLCRPENEDRAFELDRGEVVERTYPGTEKHGVVCGLVNYRLMNYLAARGRGYGLCNNPGLVLERNPDTVLCPDLMVYTENPTIPMRDWFATRLPALVVEVLDHRDGVAELIARAERFCSAGVPMAWLVCSESLTATVVRPSGPRVLLRQADIMTGYDVLPGFTCTVAELFALPGSAAPKP